MGRSRRAAPPASTRAICTSSTSPASGGASTRPTAASVSSTSARLVPSASSVPALRRARLPRRRIPPELRDQRARLHLHLEPAAGPDFSTMPPVASRISERHHGVASSTRTPPPWSIRRARELLRFDKPQFNHNGGACSSHPPTAALTSAWERRRDDQTVSPSSAARSSGTDRTATAEPRGASSADPPHRSSRQQLRERQLRHPRDNLVGTPAPPARSGRSGFRIRSASPSTPCCITSGSATSARTTWRRSTSSAAATAAGTPRRGLFFRPNGTDAGYVSKIDQRPADLIDPVAQYDHDEGSR